MVRKSVLGIFLWIILKIDVAAFKCKNGKTISDSYFCDNYKNDCGDFSDDSYGCDRDRCGAGRFTCVSNKTCIPISSRCNGIGNCIDGSDEIGCGNKVIVEECTLFKGKYMCEDGSGCIDHKYTCDDACQCLDCSDENHVNCLKFDTASCSSCLHFCVPTPKGPQCACNSSTYQSSALCKDITDCSEGSDCDQYCSRYKETTRCLCYEDFSPLPNTKDAECRIKEYFDDLLVYSTRTKIKIFNLTSEKKQTVHFETNFTALTAAGNNTYYATFHNNHARLSKISINTGKPEKVAESNSSIISIAVDWVTQNIYFTTNVSLHVCANDGRICLQLECCGVQYIVLAPKYGWMYYTQRTHIPHEIDIMRSNMDGSEKNTLIDGSYLEPVSLAVDVVRETLYWFEATEQKLHWMAFLGSDIKRQWIDKKFVPRFTVHDKTLFFTKNHENVIYSSRKFESFQESVDNKTNVINYPYVYNPILELKNQIRVEDPCKLVKCDGLCLLRPFSPNGDLNYTCIRKQFPSSSDTSSTEQLVVSSTTRFPTPGREPILRPPKIPSTTEIPASEIVQSQSSFRNAILAFIAVEIFVIGAYFLYTGYQKSNLNKPRQMVGVNICEQIEL